MVVLGFIIFTSESCAEGWKLVPGHSPVFAQTISVSFRQSGVPEYFCVEASLPGNSSYIIKFADSDLRVDAVNVTTPEGQTMTTERIRDYGFNATSEGTYKLLARGYYVSSSGMTDAAPIIPPPAGTPAREWHAMEPPNTGGRRGDQGIDDSVDVKVFRLVEEHDGFLSSGSPFYTCLSLWAVGAVLTLTSSALVFKRRIHSSREP